MVSEPIFYDTIGLSRLALVTASGNQFNPNVSVQLSLDEAQTSAYQLSFPPSLPNNRQPLFVNADGTTSTGFPTTLNLINAILSGSLSAASVIGTTVGITSNGFTSTLANSPLQSGSYTILLPSSLPSSSQPLFIGSNGQITLGYPATGALTNLTATGNITGSQLTATQSIGSTSVIVYQSATATKPNVTINTNSSQTSSYTLLLPPTLPATNAPLFTSSTGSLSFGFPDTVTLKNLTLTGILSGLAGTFSTSITSPALNLPISSASSTQVTLSANASQTASYRLVMPLQLPASTNQPLFVDNTGQITTGFPSSITISSSVTSAAFQLSNTGGFLLALNANANQNANFSITFPSSLPGSSQPLFIGSNGIITTGFPATVTLTNLTASGSVSAPNLIIPNVSGTAVTLKGSALQTANYTLTLPTSLPTSSQALLSDTSGNLSWGTVASGGGSPGTATQTTFTTFSAASPQATAANISGLQFTQVGVLQVYINVSATTNLGAVYMLSAYQVGGQWQLSYSYETSDDTDTGIDFQINASTGQVTYTSPSFAGWTATTFTWPSLTNATTSGSLSVLYPTLKLASGTNVNSPNVTVGGNGTVIFPNVLYDTVGMYSANGSATIRVAGIYLIQAQLYLMNAATGGLTVTINGNIESKLWQENTAADVQWHGSQLISVKQGDIVTLNASSNIVIFGMDAVTSTWSLTMVAPVASSGTLLAQAPVATTPSSTQGTFLSIGGPTVTDTSTAASGTVTGFAGTYLGAPTLAATNTGVTTTTASTLTIAGPPVAGTNETLTNAYSLNVQGGTSRFAGPLMANILSIPASGQLASFRGTTTSSTGGNMSFTIPTGFTWLTNNANNPLLAAGQYIVYIRGDTNSITSNGAGAGAYGDIGISQNGAGLIVNRINLNGFGATYSTYQNISYPVLSDGTTSSTITAYALVGNTTYSSTTQFYTAVIVKLG